jgi:hypothetical protein
VAVGARHAEPGSPLYPQEGQPHDAGSATRGV